MILVWFVVTHFIVVFDNGIKHVRCSVYFKNRPVYCALLRRSVSRQIPARRYFQRFRQTISRGKRERERKTKNKRLIIRIRSDYLFLWNASISSSPAPVPKSLFTRNLSRRQPVKTLIRVENIIVINNNNCLIRTMYAALLLLVAKP